MTIQALEAGLLAFERNFSNGHWDIAFSQMDICSPIQPEPYQAKNLPLNIPSEKINHLNSKLFIVDR